MTEKEIKIDSGSGTQGGGENLPRLLDPVTTMGVVQKYVENERNRTRRVVLWLGSTFILVTLLLLVLFLAVGIYVMSNSRRAARIANEASNRAAVYGTEIEDISVAVTGVSRGQSAIEKKLKRNASDEAAAKKALESDLGRFSQWVASSNKRNSSELEAIRAKLEKLEFIIEDKNKQISTLKNEYEKLTDVIDNSRPTDDGKKFQERTGQNTMPDASVPLPAENIEIALDAPDRDQIAFISEGDGAAFLEDKSTYDSGESGKVIVPPDRSRDISVVTFPNGDRYEGEFSNGLFHGWGVYYYSNGDRYEGQFKNDMKHGKGTLYYRNQDRYIGEFKDDMKAGKGTLVFADGDKYVGFFENDMINGKGTMIYKGGARYSGDFRNGIKAGNGVFRYPNGDVYEGQFHDDNRHGNGKYLFANGSKYIGEFKKGVKHGKGRYIYSSGAEYRGEFINGKYNGYGVCVYPDGRELKGLWKKGELVRFFND